MAVEGRSIMTRAACLATARSIPSDLNQLAADPSKDALLVKVTQESGTDVYFFIEDEASLAQIKKCPYSGKNEYVSIRISTLSAEHYNALIESCAEDERPDGKTLADAWSALPDVNWGETKQFKEEVVVTPPLNIDGQNFSDQILNHVVWTGFSAKNCTFKNARIYQSFVNDMDFTGSDFTSAKINFSSVENSIFTNADLRGTSFISSRLAGACFIGAKVDDTTNFYKTIYEGYNNCFKFLRHTPKQTAIAGLEQYIAENPKKAFAQLVLAELRKETEPEDGSSLGTVLRNCNSQKQSTWSDTIRGKISRAPSPESAIQRIFDFAILHPMLSVPRASQAPVPTARPAPVVS